MQPAASQKIDQLLIPGTDQDVVERYRTLAQRAQEARFGLLDDEYVVLDTETTGVVAKRDHLIEIAAALMDGPDIVARFSTFVDPGIPIPEHIVELTHITDEDVQGAPSPAEAVASLGRFVGERPIVAHNAAFDEAFIKAAAEPGSYLAADSIWLDSLELARIALPRFKNHNLSDLSAAFAAPSSTHRAIDDVEALCSIWRVLLTACTDLPEGSLHYIAGLMPQVEWPLRHVISHLAAANPDAKHFSLVSVRAQRSRKGKGEHKFDAEEVAEERPLEAPDAQAIQESFSSQGVVGKMYEEYEPRQEQIHMAQEVAAAFAISGHRVIEAGTGVGKSIAYLLPAAQFAKNNDITVGVATKTNALLDQLVHHELPLLQANLPGGLNYVAVKGYDHYPCLRKLQHYANEGSANAGTKELVMVATLIAYACQTSLGDIDPIPLYWRELPKEKVCAQSDDCLHQKCRFFPDRCFIHGARQAAKTADIVVTNHSLLFRDFMGERRVLPPIRHWIVDEAHGTEAESRRQTAYEVSARAINRALTGLGSREGAVESIKNKAVQVDGGGTLFGMVERVSSYARDAMPVAESLFSFIKDLDVLAEKSNYDHVTLWVNQQVRESGPWAVVASTGMALARKLELLVKACGDACSFCEQFAELEEDRVAMLSHSMDAAEQYSALLTVLEGEDPRMVYSVEFDRREQVSAERLVAELVEMGPALAERFYPEAMSVVYTSATIATGEDFGFFNNATGLDLLECDDLKTVQLSSSYDYENNMKVFVPKDVAEPGTEAYLKDMERLLLQVHRAQGGGVLTLFTNRRDMDKLYDKLRPQLKEEGLELVCQSHGYSAKRIRDEFLANENLSLFALRSFWEGFDAPGNTLRCVVIPKIPFGRPTDPLALEREQRAENAWKKYVLPEAIIDLKQAAGRLIRSSTDTGCLVLADSRLISKWYGKYFLSSLPTSRHRVLTVEQVAEKMANML